MILIFLILLAILVYAILGEWERKDEELEPGGGTCPECAAGVEEGWLVCPRCRTLLQHSCGACRRQTASYRPFCPWCGVRQAEVLR